MKVLLRILIVLAALSIIVAILIPKRTSVYPSELGGSEPASPAMCALAAQVAAADHAVVHRIHMAIVPRSGTSPALTEVENETASKALDASGSAAVLAALSAMLSAPRPLVAAACFDPGWKIEIVAKDGTQVCALKICFHCWNYEGTAHGQGIGGSMPDNAETLRAALNAALPGSD